MDRATQVPLSVIDSTLIVMLRSHFAGRFELLHRDPDASFDSSKAKVNDAHSELRRIEEDLDARLKHPQGGCGKPKGNDG